MIRSVADSETERVFCGLRSRKLPPDIQDKAFRLLAQLHHALDWNNVRHPPGNPLHALGGNREGRYAISINRQWRIAFRPENGSLFDVEITDYH